jgi:hypothetical protein
MNPRIFTADEVPQGSPEWWSLRRGLPTTSGFDRILTPKTLKPSAQQKGYAAELAGDVANLSPNWFSEKMSKPPNRAVEDGIKREAESRKWLEFEHDCSIQLVGCVLHENGLWECSPDGLLISDSGVLTGTLELKNPQLNTHAEYLMAGELPSEYRCQVAGHLIVTGLPSCLFLSYCPGLEPLLIEVREDEFAEKLRDELGRFTEMYLGVLKKLGLSNRFKEQRESTLAHFPSPDDRRPA